MILSDINPYNLAFIAIVLIVGGLVLLKSKIDNNTHRKEVDEHLKSNIFDPPDCACSFEIILDEFWAKAHLNAYKLIAKDEAGNIVWESSENLIVTCLNRLKKLKNQDKWENAPFTFDRRAGNEILCSIGIVDNILDLGGAEHYLEHLKEKFVIKHMTEA